MPSNINVPAIQSVVEFSRELIALNKLEDALELMGLKFSPISNPIRTSIILNKANYFALRNDLINGINPFVNQGLAQVKSNLLTILDNIPDELRLQQNLGLLRKSIYRSTNNENLEKILGTVNNLVKINWLAKGQEASKSVCQVVRADGAKGTGFVLKNGYLMTNAHVLPNKKVASATKIIFDYEEDLLGNNRKTSEFLLDEEDSAFSPLDKLDYAYIKIKDNKANPLTKWGFLEFDTFSEPQINSPVTIIQHPLGQTKQIALTANKIIGISGAKLLYLTDTEKGSSGSPVFNNDWKVIALHHAGKTEEDGGLLINPETGEKRGANEGILIKNIVEDNKNIV